MLKTLLKKKRKSIIDKWFSLIVKTYPADSAQFFTNQKNQFANPVGATISREIEILFDSLIGEPELEKIQSACDNINKIRAVQDFSASRATAFIFLMKTAIREELAGEIENKEAFDELLSIESNIDGMALITFDSYMRCREKLHKISIADVKRRSAVTLDNRRNKQI